MSAAYDEAMAELEQLKGISANPENASFTLAFRDAVPEHLLYAENMSLGKPRILPAEDFPESSPSRGAGACMGQAPATFRDTVLTWSSALMVLLGSAMFVLWAGMKVWDFYLKVRR